VHQEQVKMVVLVAAVVMTERVVLAEQELVVKVLQAELQQGQQAAAVVLVRWAQMVRLLMGVMVEQEHLIQLAVLLLLTLAVVAVLALAQAALVAVEVVTVVVL